MRKRNYGWYRAPRTTQERRTNGKRSKWGRAKRNSRNLVNYCDDRPNCYQKSWKVKRQVQYREHRGAEHSIFLPRDVDSPNWSFWLNTWELENWFDDHDIPCRIEKVEHIERCVKTTQEIYRRVGNEPYTYVRSVRPRKNGAKKVETRYETVNDWRPIYKWVTVKLDKPRETRWSTLLGYRVTWWSDKNIGIDYLLNRFTRE